MTKMKNYDCQAGLDYVAIKADKPNKKIDWEIAVDNVAITLGLIAVGFALATWIFIG